MEAKDRKGFLNIDFFADLTGDIPVEPKKGMEGIGERIRKLREEKGLSLEELSSLTGYEVEFLSSLEKNEAQPQLGTVIKLSKALDSAFGRLVSGVGDKLYSITRKDERRTVSRSTSQTGKKPVKMNVEPYPAPLLKQAKSRSISIKALLPMLRAVTWKP